MQLAACQRRLEHVGRIHRALGATGTHERVELVDEDDVASFGRGDLLENGLEPLFEFAAVLGARDEGADVERDEMLVLQGVRHVAVDDALRQALDDRGFPDAGLTDQDRVVLRTTRQHLHHAANFLVTADDGIELALARNFGEIAREALQRLVLALRLLIGDAMRAAYALERRQ